MKKLKRVGFFMELRYGDEDGGSLTDSVGKLNPGNLEKIVAYLDSGEPLMVSPGLSRDVLSPDKPIIGTGAILTDGEWAWHRDLPYYVNKFRVGLPMEFIDHMEQSNFTVGQFDIKNVEL